MRNVIYEARTKGSYNRRVERSLRECGFTRTPDGTFLRAGSGPRPWGCTVRLYHKPTPTDAFSRIIGMFTGTHDQFGRRKK